MRRAALLGTGLLLAALGGAAHATDTDDLLAALKRARTLAARGQAEVTVLFPPRAVPTRAANALPVVAVRPALLLKNFAVVNAGPQSVAGRDAVRFDLTPKVGGAGHWSLWVDRTWNVPLAFEERRADGTAVRRAAFLKVNAAPAKVAAAVPAVPEGLRGALGRALPGLSLPAGFTPVGVRARTAGGVEVTLSDGLNVLALVLAPQDVRGAPGVASRRVGKVFVWLVGNLPDAELRAALAGVRRASADTLGTFAGPGDSNP
ncbi:transcriptional regulator [Deinococcus sp. A31D244]|uniref:transcriptional regulator n=1 Tax=Deinococcus sp. A31D244 TaxID=3397675 RepID=UPI0039E0B117